MCVNQVPVPSNLVTEPLLLRYLLFCVCVWCVTESDFILSQSCLVCFVVEMWCKFPRYVCLEWFELS